VLRQAQHNAASGCFSAADFKTRRAYINVHLGVKKLFHFVLTKSQAFSYTRLYFNCGETN
jgi:hypothetical protein